MLIASGQTKPGAIVSDATTVFWIDETDGSQPGRIMRANKDGTNVKEVLTGLSNPVGLRIFSQGAALFFTNDFGGVPGGPVGVGVFRSTKDGAAPVPLSVDDGLGAGLLVLNSGFLYSEAWSASSAVKARKSDVASTGGDPACYPSTFGSNGTRITAMVANDAFYFATTASTSILQSAFDCDSSPSVFAAGQPQVRGMAADASYVFWITPDSVLRLEKANPGGTPKVLATDFDDLGGITTVAGGLVVTSRGAGTVTKVNATSRTPLACGQADPYRVADNSGSVFWTNRGTGEVMRVDLPQ